MPIAAVPFAAIPKAAKGLSIFFTVSGCGSGFTADGGRLGRATGERAIAAAVVDSSASETSVVQAGWRETAVDIEGKPPFVLAVVLPRVREPATAPGTRRSCLEH